MKPILLSLVLIVITSYTNASNDRQSNGSVATDPVLITEQVYHFVDLVSAASANDYYIRVAELEESYRLTTDPALKVAQAKTLMMYYSMIDDQTNMRKYILELRDTSTKTKDTVNLALADLYQIFSEEQSVEGVASKVEQWKKGLSKNLLLNPYIQIHTDLIMAYAKMRPQIFPFELQYLINHLESIENNPDFAIETHVILYSIVARGWSLEQSLEYVERFIEHADKYNLAIHRYIVLYNTALFLTEKKLNDASVYLSRRYLEMTIAEKNDDELFYAYERLGVALRDNGQYQEALDAFEKAKEQEESIGSLWISQINLMKAETHFYMEDLEKGSEALQKAKNILESDDGAIAVNTDYITRVLAKEAIMQGNTKAALSYYDKYTDNYRENVERQRLDNIEGVRVSMQVLIDNAKQSQQLAEKRLRHFQLLSAVLFVVVSGIIWLALRQLKTSSELKEKTIELKKLSREDGLTKLFNRGYWEVQTQQQFENLRRYEHYHATLILFDIDNFKEINDTYGHVIGDEVLKKVALVVKGELREIDIAGRYGGEEFAILLPHTSIEDGMRVAQRIRTEIENAGIEFGSQRIDFTASFGLSQYKSQHKEPQDWINEADIALYASKDKGKNQCTAFE